MILVWIGSIIAVLGLFLPWVSIDPLGSANGFDSTQGIVTAAIGVGGLVVSFLTGGGKIPPRVSGVLFFVAGLIIAIITIDAITSIGDANEALDMFFNDSFGPNSDFNPFGVPELEARNEYGVFVTLAGGILLTLGGLIGMVRRETRQERSRVRVFDEGR